MADTITAWAAWHPTKGFDDFHYEGPIAFADHDRTLLEDIADLNESDGSTPRNGWRMVKVEIKKAQP